MNFMVRPSKCFLFDNLEAALRKNRGEVGLDAASANFKNRRMFKTKAYVGLDINLDALKAGLQRSGRNAFGLWADMLHLEKLPSGFADIVVSTNTLYLFSEQRAGAVGGLCRVVAKSGGLICDMPRDDFFPDCLKILQSQFDEVKVVFYRSLISNAYEKIFEREGYLGSHPIAGLRPFRLLAWLLSRLEYLTCRIPAWNKLVLVYALQKKSGQKRVFDLSSLPLVDPNIFSAK